MPDDAPIDQNSSSQLVVGSAGSRRLLIWLQTDLWGVQEISATRRLAAWVALGITVMVAMLLATSY